MIVGTRGSDLALAQTKIVVDLLKKRNHGLAIEMRVITTSGDSSRRDQSLTGKDSFTREIDTALLNGEVDFAVHSLKDVPVDGSPIRGSKAPIEIAALPKRGSPFDVLVSRRGGMTLETLPGGARIGTSAVRRAAQLMSFRPDFRIVKVRGNVPTRIRKLRSGESNLDAIILAKAGLDRLDLGDEIDEVIGSDVLLPAAGQGCLAVSTADRDAKKIIKTIDDKNTRSCVTAERVFSSELGGGCNTPIAALSTLRGSKLRLEGLIARRNVLRHSIEGEVKSPEVLGKELAHLLEAKMKA